MELVIAELESHLEMTVMSGLFVMEEGPMAGWLYCNLNEKVDRFIVSEPRRNKWMTGEGDKDDK